MYDMEEVYNKIQVGGAKIKKFTFQFLERVKNVYTTYIQQHGVRTPLYSGGVFVSTSILQVITWRLHMVPIEFIIISIKYLLNRNESNRYRTIAYGITWNINMIYCEFNRHIYPAR